MFIAELFIVAKTRKDIQKRIPKYPFTEDWIKNMWYVYTIKYYSVMRKNEILMFATWMDLKNIMLHKISQIEKVENHMISFIFKIWLKATNKKQKLTDTDNSMVVTRGRHGGSKTVNGKGSQRYGDGRRFDFGWWVHSAIYSSYTIEIYTGNLYNCVNKCHPNKFDLKVLIKHQKKRWRPKE